MRVLKVLGLGLLLFCASSGSAFAVNPDPSKRPVPDEPAMMAISGWAFANSARETMETRVQQQLPAFKWVYPGDADIVPLPDPNRTIKLDLRESGSKKTPSGAWASIHDQDTGQTHSVCAMPCKANVSAKTDYIIAIRAAGRLPILDIIKADRPSQKRFKASIGLDLRDYFEGIGQCWADHVASGKPDTKATACARMPAVIPVGADRFGHCRVQFDVLETGWVANGRSLGCTNPVFEAPSLDVLNIWYYVPATENGQTLSTTGLTTKISFDVLDAQRRRLDESGQVAN
jgi:hypothetical protein